MDNWRPTPEQIQEWNNLTAEEQQAATQDDYLQRIETIFWRLTYLCIGILLSKLIFLCFVIIVWGLLIGQLIKKKNKRSKFATTITKLKFWFLLVKIITCVCIYVYLGKWTKVHWRVIQWRDILSDFTRILFWLCVIPFPFTIWIYATLKQENVKKELILTTCETIAWSITAIWSAREYETKYKQPLALLIDEHRQRSQSPQGQQRSQSQGP